MKMDRPWILPLNCPELDQAIPSTLGAPPSRDVVALRQRGSGVDEQNKQPFFDNMAYMLMAAEMEGHFRAAISGKPTGHLTYSEAFGIGLTVTFPWHPERPEVTIYINYDELKIK